MAATTPPGSADRYDANHQHPANRALHAIGIPLITYGVVAALLGREVVGTSRRAAVAGVAAGSALLILGHVIEGNRPAFFTEKSAVFDAVRWWGRGALRLCRRAVHGSSGRAA